MRKGPGRTYIKCGVWHLGGPRKKQKGGFSRIVGAIAKPLLLSAAPGIGGHRLKNIGKKLLVGKRKINHRRQAINYRYA